MHNLLARCPELFVVQVFLISVEVDDSRGRLSSMVPAFLSSEELPSLCRTKIQIASNVV